MSKPWAYIIGDELLWLQKEAGLSQAQVAESMKMARPLVARMEKGVHVIGMLNFARYCRATGADPGAALKRILAQYDAER